MSIQIAGATEIEVTSRSIASEPGPASRASGNINLDKTAAHVDGYLTSYITTHMQPMSNLLFPNVARIDVDMASDYLPAVESEDMLRNEGDQLNVARAVNADYLEATFGISKQTYDCKDFGVKARIDDQINRNADREINLQETVSLGLTELMKIQIENVVVNDKIFVSGVGGTGTDIDLTNTSNALYPGLKGVKWGQAGSDPESDMQIILSSPKFRGLMPNVGAMPVQVYNRVRRNPSIDARINATSSPDDPAYIRNDRQLAAILGLEDLFILRGVENSAAKGADANFGFIAPSDGFAFWYQPARRMSNILPSGVVFFNWTGLTGANDDGIRIKNFRHHEDNGDVIVANTAYDCRVLYPHLIGYIPDVI